MTPTELRPEVIQGVLEKFSQFDEFGAQFFPEVPNSAPGNIIKYDVLEFSRLMADHVAYGARAPLHDLPRRATVAYEALTIKDSIRLTPEDMKLLRDVGSTTRNQRESLVGRATRQSRLRMDRRREWWRWQMLTGGALLSATGTVPGSADGNIYFDYPAAAPNAPLGFDMGATATHILANVPGSTSWADPSANILGDLEYIAGLIEQDAGIGKSDLVVLMNRNTHQYVLNNNEVQNLVQAGGRTRDQVETNGLIEEVWGFSIKVYGATWQINPETMNDAAGTEYYIPDNVVVVCARDNEVAGRQMVACEPSDLNAPAGARGWYVWNDTDPDHPHYQTPGVEFTGGPTMIWPDTWAVYKNVTVTAAP